MSEPAFPARSLLPVLAAHVLLVALLCADVLFLGRLPYLRDVSTYYYPDYVFAASALRHGVWPLWNPTAEAGAPFLMAYPVELAMLAVLGARRTLALAPPLHVLLAMCGMTVLARERGLRVTASWMCGAAFGLSGYLQSSQNLFELSHGASLAPAVIAAYLRCLRLPSRRRIALLAVLAALQASTLAGEVALQTAVAALILTPGLPSRRQWTALAGAGALAGLLAAPAVLGARALVAGTARAAGFAPSQVLGWSAHPAVLAEAVWPRFLGDPHTMTNVGYWGQGYFPDGSPYFASLYLGTLVLAFALCAGRSGARLWLLALLGLLLALGAHGPIGSLLLPVLSHFRSPVKFFFTTTLALVLLAGQGLDAARGTARTRATIGLGAFASLLLVVGLALHLAPDAGLHAVRAAWSRLGEPDAVAVVRHLWPPALMKTGLLALLAASALWSRRLAAVPAVCVAVDLLVTNASVDASAPASFYALRPQVAELLARAESAPGPRWFSYGAANSPGLHWSPALLLRNHDLPLFAVERQALWGRSKALDGKDGAYDPDRVGWAPAGATLTVAESRPARHRANHARLRQAGVRFVLSFLPLPEDLVTRLGEARLAEMAEPLLLYEVVDPLPRAYWVPDCEVAAPGSVRARLESPGFDAHRSVVLTEQPSGRTCGTASAGRSTVSWDRPSPHEVRLRAEGDAGYLVFLEGHHRHWLADGGTPLMSGNGRYWVLPVEAGATTLRVRFHPPWLTAALWSLVLGILAVSALGLAPVQRA
ncbi:MAG TPA: hypothetical protein VFQ51_10165 [Vicinamibacteria bacterium]|nr:hypothetical protein [Vicinamibacteria bacterium]